HWIWIILFYLRGFAGYALVLCADARAFHRPCGLRNDVKEHPAQKKERRHGKRSVPVLRQSPNACPKTKQKCARERHPSPAASIQSIEAHEQIDDRRDAEQRNSVEQQNDLSGVIQVGPGGGLRNP